MRPNGNSRFFCGFCSLCCGQQLICNVCQAGWSEAPAYAYGTFVITRTHLSRYLEG